MSSQQEEKTSESKSGDLLSHLSHHNDSMPASPSLTVLDRYTALRNHRIRFQDALDPNAERVAVLHKHDIILGRGKNLQDLPGNRRMRSIINKYKHEYQSIQRSEKRDIVEAAYKEIVRGGARFLTKAPNEDCFVLVDIEVALQKVSNTLRCRKCKNKVVATSEEDNEENPCASLGPNMPSPFSRNRLMGAATNPTTSSQNQAIGSMWSSEATAPPFLLGNRSQTMSLLRENTVRLMKQMPLLPATLNDLCYLQHCQSLQRYPVPPLRGQDLIFGNDVVNAPLPEMGRSPAEERVSRRECPDTAANSSKQGPNAKVGDVS